MKKVIFVMVLLMGALVINAQAKSTTTESQSTRISIKVADLPKALTDNVAKDYAGFTIKEATSVTKNSIMTYHVVIVKGTATETLVYDKDGKFVKIHPQKDVNQHSSKKK
jgi:hypothetical protein